MRREMRNGGAKRNHKKQLQKEVKIHKNERRIYIFIYNRPWIFFREQNLNDDWISADDIYEKWKVKSAVFFRSSMNRVQPILKKWKFVHARLLIILFLEF